MTKQKIYEKYYKIDSELSKRFKENAIDRYNKGKKIHLKNII